MENVNWSVIISGIALLAAILSPVITTIINNIHETKISKLTIEIIIDILAHPYFLGIIAK